MSDRPRIMIPISRDHMCRLMVYSGVIEQLASLDASIIVLTPGGNDSPLRESLKCDHVVIDDLRLPRERLGFYWYRIYRYLFLTLIPTHASQAQAKAIKTRQPFRYWLIVTIPRPVMRFLERLWVAVRRAMLPVQLYASVFKKHDPDLVVVGSMGRYLEDYYLLRYARCHGIRSVCTIQSWDRLTTKEFELERPQRFTVWNPANRQTLVETYGYREHDVAIVGVPQFDFYLKSTNLIPRDTWLAQYGLDPNRELLFVTAQGGHVHRNLHEVVEALAEGIANGRFIKPVQVLVRPHPAVYFGDTPGQGTEGDLREYERLSPYVKGNRPQRSKALIATDTAADEHLVLANNLYHSAMLIDFYGTPAVEACVADRPVVYADPRSSFVATEKRDERVHSGIDYSRYEHLQYIFGMNGTRTARSREELYALINRYLEDPTLESEGRRAIAEAFCHKLDGRSAERMARALYDYARGIWPPGSLRE